MIVINNALRQQYVEKETKSDLYNMVNKIYNAMGIEYSLPNLRDVYRLPSKASISYSTVVTDFSNTLIKDKFLRAVKAYNKDHAEKQLNTYHLGLEGAENPIYISDHLTPKAKRLLFLARDYAKTENYSYCWSTNGKVFLRKKEGVPLIVIKSEDTLQELKEKTKVSANSEK